MKYSFNITKDLRERASKATQKAKKSLQSSRMILYTICIQDIGINAPGNQTRKAYNFCSIDL